MLVGSDLIVVNVLAVTRSATLNHDEPPRVQ